MNKRIYTANLGGGAVGNGGVAPSVTVLDLTTRTIIRRVDVPGSARAITVNPYAHQAFVATDRGVRVIGEQSLTIERAMPDGLPFAITTLAGADRQFFTGDLRSGELGRTAYSSGVRS